MPRGSGSGARQRFIIFSPLKVPAAGSAGSAGIRSSSSTSPGAPFLLFPEKLIVIYMIAFQNSGAVVKSRYGAGGEMARF